VKNPHECLCNAWSTARHTGTIDDDESYDVTQSCSG